MPQTLTHSPVRQSDSVADRFSAGHRLVTSLQRSCRRGVSCERLLQSVEDVLAGLPLTSEEYGRAHCHVTNVRRYLTAGERGAGGYELRMLAGLLAHSSH
jgi:hypothetical protein